MLLRPALAAIGLERAAADTTITALRWGTVANFIRMGRTELEALQALPDWPALAPHAAAHRIAFFYGTPDDVWVRAGAASAAPSSAPTSTACVRRRRRSTNAQPSRHFPGCSSHETHHSRTRSA